MSTARWHDVNTPSAIANSMTATKPTQPCPIHEKPTSSPPPTNQYAWTSTTYLGDVTLGEMHRGGLIVNIDI